MFKKSFSKMLVSGLSVFLVGMCFGANSNVSANAMGETSYPSSETEDQSNDSPSERFFSGLLNELPEEIRNLHFVVSMSNAALEFMGLPTLTQAEQQDFASVYRRLDRDWDNVVIGIFGVHMLGALEG